MQSAYEKQIGPGCEPRPITKDCCTTFTSIILYQIYFRKYRNLVPQCYFVSLINHPTSGRVSSVAVAPVFKRVGFRFLLIMLSSNNY